MSRSLGMLWARSAASLQSGALVVATLVLLGGPAASAAAPAGRAYELVSPPQKGSADVMVSAMKTRIAPNGESAVFASLGAFGDVVGTGLEVDYGSIRSADAWRTHSLMPRQESQPYATAFDNVTPSYDAFSRDLTHGIFSAISLLSPAPNVAAANNLYRRSDVMVPGEGTYTLLSDSSEVLTPPRTNFPAVAATSEDYTHVLFHSTLSLVPESGTCYGASVCPRQVYEWDNGTVRLVGVLPDGQPATCPNFADQICSGVGQGYIGPQSISADGSRVVFSAPTDVLGNATPSSQIYMRVNHTDTVRINASEADAPDPNASPGALFWGISPDGGKAFLTSHEQITNTDAFNSVSLYMYDTSVPDSAPNNLTLMSVDQEPADGLSTNVEGVIGFSVDGSYVYFVATGQLVAGAPTEPGSVGRMYVWHDGEVRYIGALPEYASDLPEAAGRAGAAVVARTSRVTPDGRHLLFTAHGGADLGGYDHGECENRGSIQPCSELYVYDYDGGIGGTGKLACASCNPSGASATADATPVVEVGRSNSRATLYQNHPLSDDGRRVFFTSGEALVAADDNGVKDAYEFDAETGQLHLLSTGQSPVDSYFLDATPSGDDVLIATRERLVGIDTDQAFDVYDVRVNGGIAAQNPPRPPAECASEDCHGSVSEPPAETTAASEGFLGGSGPLQIDRLVERLNRIRNVLNLHKPTARATRRLAVGKRAQVEVSVSAPGRLRLRLRARIDGRVVILARAERTVAQGGLVKLALKLSPKGQAELARRGRLHVAFVAAYSDVFRAQRVTLTLRVDGGGR